MHLTHFRVHVKLGLNLSTHGVRGDDHPDTRMSARNLAASLSSEGKYADAHVGNSICEK